MTKSFLKILLFFFVAGILTLVSSQPYANAEFIGLPLNNFHDTYFKVAPLELHTSSTLDPQNKSPVPKIQQPILLANKSKKTRKACMDKCVQADNVCERSLKIEYRDDLFKQCLLAHDQCQENALYREANPMPCERCKESLTETRADIGSCQLKTELCSQACGCEHSMDENCH